MAETVTVPRDEYDTLIRRVREQARQLDVKDRALHEKNLLLDALHMVWCDGACYGGVHRYEDKPVTEDMVAAAERNTKRLRRWFDSVRWRQNGGFSGPNMSDYHRSYLERISVKVPAASPRIGGPPQGPEEGGGA